MLDSRTVHAKEAVEILEENFGELVFKSRIRKAIKFAEAPVQRRRACSSTIPKGNAANYYRELGQGGPDTWRVVSGPACARAPSPISSAPPSREDERGAAHGAAARARAAGARAAARSRGARDSSTASRTPSRTRAAPERRRTREPSAAEPRARAAGPRARPRLPRRRDALRRPRAEGATQPDLRRRRPRRRGPHVRPRGARNSATTTGRRARTCR